MAGQWVCPSATTCADASGPLGCGPSLVCSTGTQYCQESSGGPPPLPDSGPAVGYGCESFPPDCASDHSCACLRAHGACGGGAAAQCASIDGGVTIQCAFP